MMIKDVTPIPHNGCRTSRKEKSVGIMGEAMFMLFARREKNNWLGIEDHHVSFAGERASSFFLRALDVIRQSAPSRKDLTVDLEFTGPR